MLTVDIKDNLLGTAAHHALLRFQNLSWKLLAQQFANTAQTSFVKKIAISMQVTSIYKGDTL